jgi:hypothetical protein
MIDLRIAASVGMNWQWKLKYSKPVPVPFCLPKIPHKLTWGEAGGLLPELWHNQKVLYTLIKSVISNVS